MKRGPQSLTAILRGSVIPLILLAIGGCLPSSCGRSEMRSITSADSTSRAIAASMPVDTLQLRWSSSGPADWRLDYPRALLFDPAGTLWVSDAAAHRVVAFDSLGTILQNITSELFSYPYIAGASGDSVFVFSPGRQRIQRIYEASVRDVVDTPSPPKKGLLQYAHVSDNGSVVVKLLGDQFTGYVAGLSLKGEPLWRTELIGPVWIHAGGLRSWGEKLMSLRGYQPVVDLISTDGTRDSLRLVGFDSPMLSRTRLFSLGEIDSPPLLLASGAAAGDRLFVLNMRPGWLNVDVYNTSGILQAILTQQDPAFNRDFFPTDIAVRKVGTTIHIAITLVQPEPRVDYYHWHPLAQKELSD